MAKRKRNGRVPQAKHGKKSSGSQHDKLQRLRSPNAARRQTIAALVPLLGSFAGLVCDLSKYLDKRVRFRFPIVIAGMLLSSGRRTASTWFRAAGVKDDWDRFYDFLIHIGVHSKSISWSLIMILVKRLALKNQSVIRIAVDDSPTKRFGRHVQGAGIHHNPTAGPADGEWIYGHNWVTLALIQVHSVWGAIALPIRSMLYVRQQDVAKLKVRNGWKFCTKHQLAAELVIWFTSSIRSHLNADCMIELVMDGAYVSKELFREVMKQGITIISRLRKDAKLYSLPEPRKAGQRGPNRKYGQQTLSLTKRAASAGGWLSITYRVRKNLVTRQCKSFLATSRIVGGVIKVVIVRYEDGSWAPYFSTNPELEVQQILEAVADRWSIEECFHDLKEVWGGWSAAGTQCVVLNRLLALKWLGSHAGPPTFLDPRRTTFGRSNRTTMGQRRSTAITNGPNTRDYQRNAA